eukprot:CAMPEP_0201478600 /NCGR_PEP_ID=MMETSP0151_2-20130828/3391_1 /ASSEMBLY_ACC=CAM_ASM_000257 /TAXON_ID=200890 /ORGANISM="Paramoeba atlantica, Strain 621/1 / CCAP 1560/9" /LENGTH=226 /DNA_ID=CAMNT_0047859715 /DNA_START=118 /DNA_END=798 /DNA_ORIENTATION=-
MASKTLFIHPISQPARAVWALALDAKLPIEIQPVDFSKGEHKSPDFLKINPNGTVPAYSETSEDGEVFSIGESHTILRYLASLDGAPSHWYPKDLKKRAKVDEYLDWHHTHTRKGVPFFFHKYVASKFGMEPNLERQNEGLEQYQSAIKFIEKSFLSSSPFLNGFDSPTIADLSAYAELGPLRKEEGLQETLKESPKVEAWLKRISELTWHDEVMKTVFSMTEPSS